MYFRSSKLRFIIYSKRQVDFILHIMDLLYFLSFIISSNIYNPKNHPHKKKYFSNSYLNFNKMNFKPIQCLIFLILMTIIKHIKNDIFKKYCCCNNRIIESDSFAKKN